MKKCYSVFSFFLVFFVANLIFAQKVVPVQPMMPDALFNAVAAAGAGDILQLTSGGIYPISASLEQKVALTIQTAPGFTKKAQIVFLPNTSGSYPTNMINVAASITLKNVIFNMERGTVAAWGSRFINRSTAGLPNGAIKIDGCEVYRPGSFSEGGAFDTLIVRNSYIGGHIKNKGSWGAPFSVGKSLAKYVEFTNNTMNMVGFAGVLVDGWGNYLNTGIGKVILDHNTFFNVTGDHGPANMISRTKDVVITNNLYYNPTFRPNEFHSDKYFDFPQNEDAVGDNIKVISVLGPKGIWVFSLEMGDTAKTDLTMEANNVVWDPAILKIWSDRGLQPVHFYTNETKRFIKDPAKALFSEVLAFKTAPALPVTQITSIADSAKKFNSDPVKYKGKTPFSGAEYYSSVDLKPLYDYKTKDQTDFSYPSTAKSYYAGVYTASMQALGLKGAAGYPLGDLNWFPALKANWEKGIKVGVKEIESIPTAYELEQNYPNPFNPKTNINFSIQEAGLVTLKVFNTLGQEVATLVNENMQPGKYNVDFDASKLASGIYIYKMSAGTFTSSKKMMLVK